MQNTTKKNTLNMINCMCIFHHVTVPRAQQEEEKLKNPNPNSQKEINVIRAALDQMYSALVTRLEFLGFITANSGVALKGDHVRLLWESCVTPFVQEREKDVFFRWLDTLCTKKYIVTHT